MRHRTIMATALLFGAALARVAPNSTPLMTLTGADAQAVYDASNLEETPEKGGGRKAYTGPLFAYCYRAKSLVCSLARSPAPAKTHPQGLPPRPFWAAKDEAARAFFDALAVAELVQGESRSKTFRGDAAFQCGFKLAKGVKSAWRCELTPAKP